jgi:RNAse (barnase) inhibitor barstar
MVNEIARLNDNPLFTVIARMMMMATPVICSFIAYLSFYWLDSHFNELKIPLDNLTERVYTTEKRFDDTVKLVNRHDYQLETNGKEYDELQRSLSSVQQELNTVGRNLQSLQDVLRDRDNRPH